MKMNLYDNGLYLEDVNYVSNMNLPWEKLNNKSIMISGATGLLGSFLIDVLMERNQKNNLNCKIYGLCRNGKKFYERFSFHKNNSNLVFIQCDVTLPLKREDIGTVDYILHLASNTHPLLYSTDPIGTITTNIIGVQNLLEFAVEHNTQRFSFASSTEVYGKNRGDTELFDEDYCGYINCNTLRAGYPESKRCGEALCQAYKTQKNLDIVIARLTRSYGPTMSMSDSKAISQFIKNAVNNENIVLKSEGNQYFSYTYMSDAVSGLLWVLLKGENGEAYNIADKESDITLRDLANIIATIKGKEVVYEIPSPVEVAGYSKATLARLNGQKLQLLGWKPQYDINKGIERTLNTLDSLMSE